MSKKYQLFYLDKVFFETDEHELMYKFMEAASTLNYNAFMQMSFYEDGVPTAKTLFIWTAEEMYATNTKTV